MDQLLAVPDRAVHLLGTIQTRTPGTVLDEGLGTVPTLAVLVLEDREEGNLTGLDATAVFDGEVAVGATLTLAGGDDDDAVSGTGTVEGRSGSALQDGQALDVLVGKGVHAAHNDTIHHIERLVVTVDGAVTTDNHIHGSTRVGRRRRNLQTGNLTREGGGHVGRMLTGEFLVLHGRRRIAEGLFRTCDAHRRHDDFVQHHRIFLHRDVHLASGDRGLDGLHAEEVEGQGLSGSCRDGEHTVGTRDNAQRRAIHDHGDTGYRLTFCIGDSTGYRLSLRECCREHHQKARHEQFYFFHKHEKFS